MKVISLFLGILAMFLAIYNGINNPQFESPDEHLHYQYVRFLIDEHSLPIVPAERHQLTEYHQPPLYYLFGALLTSKVEDDGSSPTRNDHWTSYKAFEVHRDNKRQFLPDDNVTTLGQGTNLVVLILRGFSIILFGGTLIIVWRTGKEIWPGHGGKQTLFLTFVAFNPMLLYISSSVNNDSMIVFLGSMLFYLSIVGLRNGFRLSTTYLIGLVWGLAILSKISGLLLFAPWFTGLVWLSWREKNWRFLINRSLIIGLVCMAVSGWWFARNIRLYQELTGTELMLDYWGERQLDELDLTLIGDAASYAWSSFWGRFGYGQIVLPKPIYWFYTYLAGFGFFGVVRHIITLIRSPNSKHRHGWTLIFLTTLLMFVTSFAYFFFRNPSGANGRYTFPAIIAFSGLMVTGISTFKLSKRIQISYVALLASMALFSIGILLPWTYSPPTLIDEDEALAKVSTEHSLLWMDSIKLIGTSISPREITLETDSEADFTACWKSEAEVSKNYTFFVHVLDPELNVFGQRDMHPGLGNFPTSLWKRGDIFCDTFAIPLSNHGLKEPTVAFVEIGLYDGKLDSRVPATTNTGQSLDFIVVDRIKVQPSKQFAYPEPTHLISNGNFSQGVSIKGYEWSTDLVSPGQAVTLKLWWSAEGPLDADYTVFAHLYDSNGDLVGQADKQPRGGRYPTSLWGREVILDEHTFVLPAEIIAGAMEVHLGFYKLSSGERLGRVDDAIFNDSVALPGPIVSD